MTTTKDSNRPIISNIVVARYNEDLTWLKDTFKDDDVFVYNKGEFIKSSELPRAWKLFHIKNVGREAHTYLYHIVKNYERLADVTAFIQGRIEDHIEEKDDQGNVKKPVQFLWDIAKQAYDEGISGNTFYVHPSVKGAPSPWFKIADYRDDSLKDSGRTFGEWFANFIAMEYPLSENFLWYGAALFAVSKENILRHPKAFYERLLATVDHHAHHEEAHYLERAWYYMMSPKTNAVSGCDYAVPIISHSANERLWKNILAQFKKHLSAYAPFIIVGDPELNDEFTYNPKQSLITVRCKDTYEGLSQKVYLAIKAVTTLVRTTRGIIKMDDDVFVNLDQLDTTLENIHAQGQDYVGVTVRGNRWCDFHKDKVADREAHGEPVFLPDCVYCGGPMYVLSNKAATCYLERVDDMDSDKTTFHLYEDVNMGHILSQAGIQPHSFTIYVDDDSDGSSSKYQAFLNGELCAFHDKEHKHRETHFDKVRELKPREAYVETPLNIFLAHDSYYDVMSSPLIHKPKPIKGQADPYVTFLYESTTKPKNLAYSIVMPVHDQEEIIVANIKSIVANTVGTFEMLFVFDGCTDSSEKLALDYLASKNWSLLTNIARICVVHQETSIFETSCDNMLFRLAKGKYIVEIQADMQIMTYGYNQILSNPVRLWNDVIAVSGKACHRFFKWLDGNGVGRIYGNQINEPLKLAYDDMNVFFEWETVNRGPLLFDADKLRALGYLDEQNFVLGDDDHDLMARAWFQKKWRCGLVPIEVYMPMERGTMRKAMKETDKNILEIRKKRCNGGFLEQIRDSDYKSRELIRHVMDDDAIAFADVTPSKTASAVPNTPQGTPVTSNTPIRPSNKRIL